MDYLKSIRNNILQFIRHLRLLKVFGAIHFISEAVLNRKLNRKFVKEHPGISLPPDYLMYESFKLRYENYYNGGLETAKWLAGMFNRHSGLEDKIILDWGCGPGRIIRHLPMLTGQGCRFYGVDLNRKSIDWCRKNLENIYFISSDLNARLPFDDCSFDIIIAISVFTHLSESSNIFYSLELFRILKPGGTAYISMQGASFKQKLTLSERKKFESGGIVTRGFAREGTRVFSTFHPETSVKQLFNHFELVDHIYRKEDDQRTLAQDLWVLRKGNHC
jgi:SAM-dependent methyltransferase